MSITNRRGRPMSGIHLYDPWLAYAPQIAQMRRDRIARLRAEGDKLRARIRELEQEEVINGLDQVQD